MPKTYKASMTFIVNEETGGFNISTLLNDLPLGLSGMASTNVDKYVALLESRRIKDVIIKEFDLWNVYEEDYIEFVYKKLNNNIDVIDNLDGTVTVNCFYEKEPEKAAAMAQRIYDELYALALELQKEKSRDYREFLEGSLEETYKTLATLEDSLKEFQMENRILQFEQQAEFSFEALAELEAQNMLQSVEYEYLKGSVSANNPELLTVKQRLEAIQNKKTELYREGEEYIMAFSKMPEYGLQYFRLFRDITIQQEILKILLPIVQNARIEEKKETVNIQLIDAPFIPQYKSKPKRLTYMIIFTMLVGIFELLFFAVWDAYKNNKSEIDNWVLRDGK
jgi:capsule polysaccharide export protein KpsE/RkpR